MRWSVKHPPCQQVDCNCERMPKPKILPPRAITGSNGDMSGLRAAEVPPDSDSEGEPALPVLTSGQVVVAATQPQVLLPWEQGVFRDIFQSRPILECSLPTPQVILPVDETTVAQEPEVGRRSKLDQGTSAKSARGDHSADVFSKVIRHNKADLSFQENVTAMWAKAISKWQTLFEASPSASFTRQLENMDQEAKMSSLRDMFGSKSPHTVEKRAASLMRFFKWLQAQAELDEQTREEPLSPSEASVYRFCRHISAGSKGKLAAQGFVQALTFVRFVLAVPAVQICLSPRVQGLADRMAGEHEPSNQARDLTVLEVIFLEQCLADTSFHLLDRFAAGVFLFQIYARDRWSDIRFVKTLEFDILQLEGETRGYVEGRAKDVKQSNRRKKQNLFMPLVAPVRGVHPSVIWGTVWQSVAQQVGRDFAHPLLPAVGPDGGWLRRRVDSPEASDWLTRLLQKREPSLTRVTTHSLKHTTLGWLSKFGVYGETQTLLAHHSTGPLSTLAYSRDALSGPLRKLESLLYQVRTGKFCPDSTRSGYWKASSGPECAESSVGSWDFLPKDTGDTLQGQPGWQRPEGRSLQDTDEPLPPDGHIGHPPKEVGDLDDCEREDSPSAAPVDDEVLSSGPEPSETSWLEVGASDSAWETSIQQALLFQGDAQPQSAAGDSDTAEASSSGSDTGQRPLLVLPEGWRAIQNVKSTMLHLYKEGATALKCGAWISHNFVDMERPTTVWVRCSKCFA